jgi:hypothetical protein
MANADTLQQEFSKLLVEYGDEVTDGLKKAVPVVAKEATEEIRKHAPESNGRRSGTYKKAITTKKADETNT